VERLIPVYVDCLPDIWAIDPGEVSRAISPRTAAICPVRSLGLPPDFDELERISEKHGIRWFAIPHKAWEHATRDFLLGGSAFVRFSL